MRKIKNKKNENASNTINEQDVIGIIRKATNILNKEKGKNIAKPCTFWAT